MAREIFGKTRPKPRRLKKKKSYSEQSQLLSASLTQLKWDCQKRAEETDQHTWPRQTKQPGAGDHPDFKHTVKARIAILLKGAGKKEVQRE